MALIVEDGTGLSNAESYISVEDADEYFTSKRGPASTYEVTGDWLHEDITDAVKEACLRWATKLLDKHWAWDGDKSTSGQKLRWPRTYAEDDEGDDLPGDELPEDLVYATAEMARALLVDPDRVEDQEIGIESVDAEVKTVFDKYDRAGTLPKPVKQLLSSLGKPKGGGSSREVARG